MLGSAQTAQTQAVRVTNRERRLCRRLHWRHPGADQHEAADGCPQWKEQKETQETQIAVGCEQSAACNVGARGKHYCGDDSAGEHVPEPGDGWKLTKGPVHDTTQFRGQGVALDGLKQGADGKFRISTVQVDEPAPERPEGAISTPRSTCARSRRNRVKGRRTQQGSRPHRGLGPATSVAGRQSSAAVRAAGGLWGCSPNWSSAA